MGQKTGKRITLQAIPELLISGRFWVIKCLIATFFIATVFMCTPSILIHKNVALPPAYELKAQHPFADTSTLTVPPEEGERSHGAKLTPRLVGSILLAQAMHFSLHPYLPSTFFGIFFLLSGILTGYRLTGDRLAGLFLGMTFAGLNAAAVCFSFSAAPKPFDGIAMGLLGLALITVGRPWLLAAISFFSCWTDERALVSLALVMVLILVYPDSGIKSRFSRFFAVAGSVVLYLIMRVIISTVLQWGPPDLSRLGLTEATFVLYPFAAWFCFKGGWMPILFAAWILYNQQDHARLSLLIGSVATATAVCLFVLDISRASCFAFPLIPVSYALLKGKGVTQSKLRILAGAGAAISLIAPNFEIIAPHMVRWVQPMLPLALLKIFHIVMH